MYHYFGQTPQSSEHLTTFVKHRNHRNSPSKLNRFPPTLSQLGNTYQPIKQSQAMYAGCVTRKILHRMALKMERINGNTNLVDNFISSWQLPASKDTASQSIENQPIKDNANLLPILSHLGNYLLRKILLRKALKINLLKIIFAPTLFHIGKHQLLRPSQMMDADCTNA